MNLKKAMLCITCEEIHDQKQCPACGSKVYFPIAAWLNRQNKNEPVTGEAREVAELERLFGLYPEG